MKRAEVEKSDKFYGGKEIMIGKLKISKVLNGYK